jgi:hypothetical protein
MLVRSKGDNTHLESMRTRSCFQENHWLALTNTLLLSREVAARMFLRASPYLLDDTTQERCDSSTQHTSKALVPLSTAPASPLLPIVSTPLPKSLTPSPVLSMPLPASLHPSPILSPMSLTPRRQLWRSRPSCGDTLPCRSPWRTHKRLLLNGPQRKKLDHTIWCR